MSVGERAALDARLAGLPASDAWELLERLGRQPYVSYIVKTGNRRARRYDKNEALAFRPVNGATIIGVRKDGVQMLAYKAISGTWLSVRGKITIGGVSRTRGK